MGGWKTISFALVLTVLGAIQQFIADAPLDPEVQGYVLMGIGVVVGALRFVTNSPVFQAFGSDAATDDPPTP